MDVAGMALAIYKDVYFLSKSVYKLAVSPQHYKPEHHDLIEDFYHEWRYLRTFHNFFFANTSGKLVRDHMLSNELANEVLKVCRGLQHLFSDYKGIALENDEQYQKYQLAAQECNNIALFDFPLSSSDVMLPCQMGPRPKRNGRTSSFSLRVLIRNHRREQSIYQTKAWKLSLFQRKQLARLVAIFREHNQQLKYIEPLWLANLHRTVLPRLVESIMSDPLSDQTAFVPHVHLRGLSDEDSSFSPYNDHSRPVTQDGSQLEIHHPIALPRIWTEYKTYEVAFAESSTDGSPSIMSGPWSPQSIGSSPSSIERSEIPQEMYRLARLLSAAGSSNSHVLPFHGYRHEPDNLRFAFYFDFPRNASPAEPTTLHQLITSLPAYERFSLSERFNVALMVSKSLGAVHAGGLVHRSIMSHSILFFRDQEFAKFDLAEPYLSGFEYSRPESGETKPTFGADPEKNLYRHPDHQGYPTVQFDWLHDIYALGVVLLEIGVWQTAAAIRKAAMKRPDGSRVSTPKGLQQLYLDHARTRLKHSMGESYMNAVVTCLSGEMASHANRDNFTLVFRKMVVDRLDPRRLLDLPGDD